MVGRSGTARSPQRRMPECFASKVGVQLLHSLKRTACTWTTGVGRWVSFWNGFLAGAMLVLGRGSTMPDKWNRWNKIQISVALAGNFVRTSLIQGNYRWNSRLTGHEKPRKTALLMAVFQWISNPRQCNPGRGQTYVCVYQRSSVKSCSIHVFIVSSFSTDPRGKRVPRTQRLWPIQWRYGLPKMHWTCWHENPELKKNTKNGRLRPILYVFYGRKGFISFRISNLWIPLM